MPSAVSICNIALDTIGCTPIMQLTEDNPRAEACNRNYADVLREVEESSNWNFLKRGGTLALVSPQPAQLFGWSYVYGLPVGFLRVIQVNGELFTGQPSELWEIQNNRLYADADTVALEYTVYDEDASKFGSQFAAAVAMLLASRIAGPLTQDGGQRQVQYLQTYHTVLLPKARRFDGSQTKAPVYNAMYESRWTNAHR